MSQVFENKTIKSVFRQCIACKKQNDKKLMLRFICSNIGIIEFDVKGLACFRGAWICSEYNCLKKAVLKNEFNRSFAKNININFSDFLNNVIEKIKVYILSIMGLAFKTRQCIIGRDLVLKEVDNNKVFAVFLASDLKKRSVKQFVNKIDKLNKENILILTIFNKSILSDALGRLYTGIVALRKGNISNRIVCEFKKLNNLSVAN